MKEQQAVGNGQSALMTETWFASLMLLAGLATAGRAQQPRTIFQLAVELAVLSVVPDTVSGLAVIMQPSPASKQGKGTEGYI